MKCIRDRWTEIRDKATILGVSGGSLESHHKFIKKQNLPFPLIYDEHGEVSEAYGVRKEYSILWFKFSMTQRVTFVIDEEGKIHEVLDKVKVGSHAENLLGILD